MKINKNEELTQKELDRIFFDIDNETNLEITEESKKEKKKISNSEKKPTKDKKEEPKKEKKKIARPEKKPTEDKKEEPQKKKKRKYVKRSEIWTTREAAPGKRKHGRPVIWTPEKIAESKELHRRKKEQERQHLQEIAQIADLSGTVHSSSASIQNKIATVIKSREEIQNIREKQRKKVIASINRRTVAILDQKSKCTNHVYKMSHYDEITMDPIGVCIYCSKMKKFTPYDWRLYLYKNRDKL